MPSVFDPVLRKLLPLVIIAVRIHDRRWKDASEKGMTHMATTEPRKAVDSVEDAEAARAELHEALTEAGILLPSLGLDTVSFGCDYLPPLVDLGRCSPGVARKLAAALRGCAP